MKRRSCTQWIQKCDNCKLELKCDIPCKFYERNPNLKKTPYVKKHERKRSIEEKAFRLACKTKSKIKYRRKLKTKIWEREISPFPCPECGENSRINLIRRRRDLYDCRTCGKTFIKENVFEEFDFEMF